jgi:hypothetical protein
LKTFCHVILGIPLFVLYLPCIYILALVECCTFGHCVFFTKSWPSGCRTSLGLFMTFGTYDFKDKTVMMRSWRFGRIDNESSACFLMLFVYIPLMQAFIMVYYIPFLIYSCIRDYVIPCCIFMFRRGEQATSTEIKPHALILKE